MKEKVTKYVDHLFGEIQSSQQISELKEEIIGNLIEKIIDLMVSGKSEEEAFKDAVASIGDISELMDSLEAPTEKGNEDCKNDNNREDVATDKKLKEPTKKEKNSMIFMSTLSSALWIFAFALFFIIGFSAGWKYSWLVFIFALAIQLLVVAFFWKITTHSKGNYEELLKILSVALWVLSFGLFFVVGFSWAWKYSWLVFIFAIVVQLLLVTYFWRIITNNKIDYEELMGILSGALWIFSFGLFFIVGFNFGWRFSWLVFVAALILQLVLVAFCNRLENGKLDYEQAMGLLSGALWILATALFFVIGFNAGWKYSWLTFVFATGIQVLMAGYFVSD